MSVELEENLMKWTRLNSGYFLKKTRSKFKGKCAYIISITDDGQLAIYFKGEKYMYLSKYIDISSKCTEYFLNINKNLLGSYLGSIINNFEVYLNVIVKYIVHSE